MISLPDHGGGVDVSAEPGGVVLCGDQVRGGEVVGQARIAGLDGVDHPTVVLQDGQPLGDGGGRRPRR